MVTPDPRDERLLTNVIAGMVSGAFASAVANPTDVLKVRMQAANDGKWAGPTARGSVLLSFANMYREEGVRGLYRVSPTMLPVFSDSKSGRATLPHLPSLQGVGPTMQRATVVAGVILPVYDLCKHHLLWRGAMPDALPAHFV